MSNSPVEYRVRLRVFERDGYCCWYCGRRLLEDAFDPVDQPTLDHRLPASRLGSHRAANLVCACRSCNSQKRSQTVEKYRQWLRARDVHLRAKAFIEEVLLLVSTPLPPIPAADWALVLLIRYLDARVEKVVFYGEEAEA